MSSALLEGPHVRSRDSAEALAPLFESWQQHEDRRAREALVARFTPLARSLARRYARSAEPLEDLVQIAMVGLLNAIDRFDARRANTFSSFAVPTILGEIRRYFRDCGWSMRVPRSLQERTLKVARAQEEISSERRRAATVCELAERLELSVEEVGEALQSAQAYDVLSLDAPFSEEETSTCLESIGQIDRRYELIELDASVSAALGEVPVLERKILYLRFMRELTQTEIAERIGVSQMQVSRLLRRSLERLRALADG